ncbi:phage baseplate protein [Gallibacterium anatis 10672-6]|uniref:GPW/gp25 family protein n=1 Tax=Gallibacterium anatis TaxID=750 RepID=UPI0005321CE8|nr:GPW/gp25 family protein [Gallibacterium anatis]KGQ48626.1 phage baseplate protein [Gallibacterium anatis 10672-6]
MNTNLILSTHWQLAPALNEQAVQGIDDIHQCIDNILNTLKGTDILRPEFGSDHFQYIDQPEDVAWPNMVREITLALKRWETRIEVESVHISGQASHFELLIFWTLVDDVYRELYQTQVAQ